MLYKCVIILEITPGLCYISGTRGYSSSTVYWEKNFRNTHVRRDLNNIGKFIRAKRESTLLEGQRVGGLYGIGCMDSRKDVTEAKEECSATACCSSGCKSCRDP